jgi:hypothetical protein
MKKQILILGLVFAFAGIQFLYAQKTEKRNLPAFNGIFLSAGVTVHLNQGDVQMVELQGNEETISKLITEVKNGNLIIRYPDRNIFAFHIFDQKHVDLNITMTRIERLGVSGTGSIFANDLIDSKELNVSISGTGNLRMNDLKTEKISAHLSGTGTLTLAGKQPAAVFKASISGTGSVKALDFKADDVNVSISGTGSCSITSNKNLVTRLSGTGSVNYRGNPRIDSKISGVGHVRSVK